MANIQRFYLDRAAWHRLGNTPVQPGQTVDTPVDPAFMPYWGAPVWRDEFTYRSSDNIPMIDPAKWNIRDRSTFGLLGDASIIDRNQIGVDTDGRAHLYANWMDTPVITATGPSEPASTYRWHRTGYMDHRFLHDGEVSFKQRYGRWEIRAKMPTGPNSLGTLAAFWLRNDNTGEIDIVEAWGYGQLPNGLGQYPGGSTLTTHTQTSSASGIPNIKKVYRIQELLGSGGSNTLPNDPVYNDFHTWALEWTPDYFRGYFDGTRFCEETPASYPYLWDPMFFGSGNHVRINLHIGTSTTYWGLPDNNNRQLTTDPQDYQIEHVRIWALPN